MERVEPARGGFRRRLTVWEAVNQVLSERGEETMVNLHRAYKDMLRDAYAEEWKLFNGGHRRPYRVIGGKRVYLKKPPRGMTYLSFTRYVNSFVNEGLLEKVAPDKRSSERYVANELLEVIKQPVFYRLK